jgi:hypothetical protein
MFTCGPGFFGAAAPLGVTWNPADFGSALTLSGGNLTATYSSGSNCGGRATTSHSTTGKYYFEQLWTTVNAGTNSPMGGIVAATWPFLNATFNAANAWGIQSSPAFSYGNGSFAASGVTFANGDIMGCAVDFAAGNIWFAKNNVWINSGNPSAGTNPAWTGVTGTLFPAVRITTVGVVTARFALASFTYTPPTGFGIW